MVHLLRIAIVYASNISRASGTSERVLQIAKGLSGQGAQVTLSGVVGERSDGRNNLCSNSNLQILGMPNRIAKVFDILRWFVHQVANSLVCKNDIVQIESFSLIRTLMVFLIMRPLGKKFVIVYHDKCFTYDPRKSFKGRFELFFQRTLLKFFDASITPGQSVKNWFEELHGLSITKNMLVIPNGVIDAIQLHDAEKVRSKYQINIDSFAALFFGSMTFKPNFEAAEYLHSISDVVSTDFGQLTGKKLIFVVAGIGSEKLRTTNCFIPIGFVPELGELLSLPNIIVFPHLPSHSGPHVKTIYAFLSGKAVIATEDAVKDMPHLVSETHYLPFNTATPESLTHALVSLYSETLLAENLGCNAKKYARSYSWENIAFMHLKLYKKLL